MRNRIEDGVEARKAFTLLTLLNGQILLILNDLLASKGCQRWQISVILGGAQSVTSPGGTPGAHRFW